MGRPIGSALEMRMVATTPPSPASPPTGTVLLYFKSDGLLYQKTSAGIETVVSGLPSGGATTQYLRGDKSWQTLDKTAAGLPNVDNTSDVNKPVSTAQQTALNLKAPVTDPAFVNSTRLQPSGSVAEARQVIEFRTMPSVVNNTVDLGTATFSDGAGTVRIALTVSMSGYSVSRVYEVASFYGETAGAWKIAPWVSGTGQFTGNDFQLEVMSNAATILLRIRNIAGTLAPVAVAVLDFTSASLTWTPSTAVTVAAAAVSGFYPSSMQAYSLNLETPLTQAKTHASPDTDVATTSLHHTLGTGANQAAAGNHLHTGTYEPPIAAPTGTPSLQYWRGDKSWQTLNLAALPDAWVKRSVRVASTANVVIATGGLQTVDGITLAAGDRVLLKDQTTPAENGIYQVNAGAWTRATDATTSAMMSGADVAVDSGTQGGWLYSNLFKVTDTLGTTAMYWYRVVDTSMLATVKVTTTGFITLSGTQVIDGVSVVTGDRVLVRMQGTLGGGNQYDNGIYVVQTGAWTRATDADAPNKLAGQSVYVQQGGQHGGVTFKCSMLPTDTLGVTSVQYSAARVESVGYLGYPAAQGNGHTIYDFNRQMLATYDVGASAWRYSGVAQVAATAPANPVVGWQWYDTTAKVLKVWDGAIWQGAGGFDTGWINLTIGTGATKPTGAIARIRQIGNVVYWEIGNCTLAAAANQSTNGGITDTPIASVPTTGSPIVTLPATNQRVAGFVGARPAFFNMGPTGAIVLYAADGYGTATTIGVGSQLQFSGTYMV